MATPPSLIIDLVVIVGPLGEMLGPHYYRFRTDGVTQKQQIQPVLDRNRLHVLMKRLTIRAPSSTPHALYTAASQ